MVIVNKKVYVISAVTVPYIEPIACDCCGEVIGYKSNITDEIRSTPNYYGNIMGYDICKDCADTQFNFN